MDWEVRAELRTEFPDGEAWAWEWYRARGPIFWDSNKKRLTQLSDRQILIALQWVVYFALPAFPNFYPKERQLWERYFVSSVR